MTAGADDPPDLAALVRAARRFGPAPCFTFLADGGEAPSVPGSSVTFGDLVDRAERVAGGLSERGVAPGDRIVLFAAPDVAYVTAMLGALLAGLVVAPVNHQFKRRELEGYLRLVQPGVVVCDEARGELVAEVGGALPRRPEVVTTGPLPGRGWWSFDELATAAPRAPIEVAPDRPAFVMHTSGTTGLPKGVVRTHGAYARFAHLWARRYLAPDDTVISFMPMYHQGGVMMSLLPAMVLGRPTFQLERFSVPAFWGAARRHAATWAVFMPPVPTFLVQHEGGDSDGHRFQWAMTGGRVDHWAAFQERFSIVGHSGYGSTETTMVTMTGERGDPPAGGRLLHGPRGGFACGRPIDGWNEVRVVGDDGAAAPVLAPGHLEFRGPGVFTEYYANPEATAAAFTADGWFRPGDVGYVDEDGLMFMIDRSRDLIRRSGENIAPREIEDVLHDHADVEEAAVVPVEDEVRGQEIRACVVLRPGATTTATELFAHCAEHLSAFKVPRYLDLRRELPHTPTFKVRKEALLAEVDRTAWVDRSAADVASTNNRLAR